MIPALNEEKHLPQLLSAITGWTDQPDVIVVDNGSTDRTADVARSFEVTLVQEPRQGKGFAARSGAAAVMSDWVFLCDADITGLTLEHVDSLRIAVQGSGSRVGRLLLDRPAEAAPVTLLTAKPLLALLGRAQHSEPLGGLIFINRALLLQLHLSGGWGFDVGITMHAYDEVIEVVASGLTHRAKPLQEYESMAAAVARTILQTEGLLHWDHADCSLCHYEPSLQHKK